MLIIFDRRYTRCTEAIHRDRKLLRAHEAAAETSWSRTGSTMNRHIDLFAHLNRSLQGQTPIRARSAAASASNRSISKWVVTHTPCPFVMTRVRQPLANTRTVNWLAPSWVSRYSDRAWNPCRSLSVNPTRSVVRSSSLRRYSCSAAFSVKCLTLRSLSPVAVRAARTSSSPTGVTSHHVWWDRT